jgi:hypothetical protein
MIFTRANQPQNHYIYAYIRNKDSAAAKAGTPYYIGKGYGPRAWSLDHKVLLPSDNRYIIIIEHDLTELGALALERRLIRWYGRLDNCTGILRNMTDGGDGVTRSSWPEARRAAYLKNKREGKVRKPHTQETKDKIGRANKGKSHKRSKEAIQKASESMTGRVVSNETRSKISAANKGRKLGPMSEEDKLKRSLKLKGRPSPTKNTKLSEEHRRKISESNKGRKCPKTEEHRRKLSEANEGKKLSDETRAKMSKANRNRSDETREKLRRASLGRVVSQETRDKISAATIGKPKRKKIEHTINNQS